MSETSMNQAVREFLQAKEKKLFIDGKWVNARAEKTFEVENPATTEKIATVAYAQKEDVDLAVKAARRAVENSDWTMMTPTERSKRIWRLGELLEKNAESFAQLESIDNGKPAKVAAAADLPLAIDMFYYMAGWATKLDGKTFPVSVPYMPDSKFVTSTVKEPVGVAGQIIPWNFPLLMAAWKVAPALAAGCSVLLKPAEQTPLTALLFGQLIEEADIPAGVVNILTGPGDTGAAISAHPDIDKVAFTGSTEVGRKIIESAKGNLKKVSLELGGKSPNIIFDDADLERAIPASADAIFFNSGQCCAAGSRLFVHEKAYDQVLEGLTRIAKEIKVGDGLHPESDLGPVVSKEQYERVCSYLEIGQSEGATQHIGGLDESKSQGYFVKPTIFTDTQPSMKISQEEIFGPVLTVQRFKDEESLVQMANNTSFGLGAGLWTKDVSRVHRVSSRLKAGSVWVNCYNVLDSALPFGGYKESGWGREMGREAVELYTETKSLCMQIQ